MYLARLVKKNITGVNHEGCGQRTLMCAVLSRVPTSPARSETPRTIKKCEKHEPIMIGRDKTCQRADRSSLEI